MKKPEDESLDPSWTRQTRDKFNLYNINGSGDNKQTRKVEINLRTQRLLRQTSGETGQRVISRDQPKTR